MDDLKFNNGIIVDNMDGNCLLTEEKLEEILIAEGYDLYGGNDENVIDSCIVMNLAYSLGLKNLGDYGDGCIFYMDSNIAANELLKYVQ